MDWRDGLTSKETAARLGITRAYVGVLGRTGTLERVRMPYRPEYRYSRVSIDALIQQRAAEVATYEAETVPRTHRVGLGFAVIVRR